MSVTDLARPLALKLPAMMKHLAVLSNVGWLHRYERFWAPRLERLAAYAEARAKRK